MPVGYAVISVLKGAECDGCGHGPGVDRAFRVRGGYLVVDHACLAYSGDARRDAVRAARRNPRAVLLASRAGQTRGGGAGAHRRGLLASSPSAYEIIIIIVGHDDPGTAEVVHRPAWGAPERILVVTYSNAPKSKPRALNAALPYCRGEVVGVFDAEDQIHPLPLGHVHHAFRSTIAGVVQGGAQLINFHSSWYSLHTCLEGIFCFRSRLHLHARKGFIPLGDNTVVVKTAVLRIANGWDRTCLAEDCHLGVRLFSRGARAVVAYDSAIVTKEVQTVGLHDFGKQYGLRIPPRHNARLVIDAFPDMLTLSAAAMHTARREYNGRRNWELTRHVGAHLALPVPPAGDRGGD
jgi:cellulose synthase/poly-beta-1,6-N-acetylglucosamine synthase-like glycosyltransferase